MIHSKVGEGSRRIARSCKLHLHNILLFSLYTHCVQTTYNVCSTYKYFKYSSTYKYLAKYLSISTSTLGKLRKYLSKVQVLSNLYLSVLKYKYSCTWPHVWYIPDCSNKRGTVTVTQTLIAHASMTYSPYKMLYVTHHCMIIFSSYIAGLLYSTDWTGLDWTGLDWTGLDWTGLEN